MSMTSGMGWVMAMMASVLMIFAGVVSLLTLTDNELQPLGWLFVVVGGLLLVTNFAIRKRTP